MLNSLHIENLTVFPKADLRFGANLNVIIGENGSGKSHLLKAAYVPLAVSAAPVRLTSGMGSGTGTGPGSFDNGSMYEAQGAFEAPGKAYLQRALAEKLVGVFRPDSLGRLVSRKRGRKCTLAYRFDVPEYDLVFTFSTPSKNEVKITSVPTRKAEKTPVFLPTRELLTIAPGFVYLYDNNRLTFEETWRDTCHLLEAPLARGPREAQIKILLEPLERVCFSN